MAIKLKTGKNSEPSTNEFNTRAKDSTREVETSDITEIIDIVFK